MAEWVATVVDNVSATSQAMKTAILGFGQGLSSAASSSAGFSSATNVSAASLRAMYAEADVAKAKLARLESTKATLEKSGAIDIKLGQGLSKEIEATKGHINGITEKIAKSGGAAFDTKAFDKKTTASASSLGKMSGIAGKAVLAALAVVPAAAMGALYAIGSKALQSQYMAQVRLNAIQSRFNMGLMAITKNANLKPVLDGLDRMAAMFDANTTSGKLMGEFVKDAFDLVGSAVTALTPVAEKTFASLLVFAIDAETAFWDVVDAVAVIGETVLDSIGQSPETLKALGDASTSMGKAIDDAKAALVSIGEAFGAAGENASLITFALGIVKAEIRSVSIVFSMLGGFVSGVMTAIGGAAKVIKGIFTGDLSGVVDGLKQMVSGAFGAIASLVFGQVKVMANAIDTITGGALGLGDKVASLESGMKSMLNEGLGTNTATATKGKGVGTALGDGIKDGIVETSPAVAKAAADAVAAAIAAAKARGQIHSPSRAMRFGVGRELGRGTALGIMDEASNVQSAAEEALIPDMSKLDASGAASSNGASKAMSKSSSSTSKNGSMFNNCFNGAVFGGDLTQTAVEGMLLAAMDKATRGLELSEATA